MVQNIRKTNTPALYDSTLVGWWTFDGKDCGLAYCMDKGSAGAIGTLNGGVEKKVGKIGGGLNLDGVNDSVTVAASSNLNMNGGSVTMSLWVKSTSGFTTEKMLIEHDTWANAGVYQFTAVDHDTLRLNFIYNAGEGGRHDVNFDFTDGKWHHLVAQIDAGAAKERIYIDGVLTGGEYSILGGKSIGSSDAATYIGSRGNSTLFFPGQIDDVRVYSRALTPNEVYQLYRSGGVGHTTSVDSLNRTIANQAVFDTGLKSYWTLDSRDTSGVTLADTNPNATKANMTNFNGIISPGRFSQGLKINSGYASSTPSMNYGAGSISLWVKRESLGGTNYIYWHNKNPYDNTCYDWLHITSSNTLQWNFKGFCGAGIDKAQTTVKQLSSINRWYHIVVSCNKVTPMRRIYVDGVMVSQYVDATYKRCFDSISSSGDSGSFVIGAGAFGGTPTDSPFKGVIDDIRIYNRELSMNEIQQLYRLGAPVVTLNTNLAQNKPNLQSGLVGYWTFDGKDCGLTYCVDKSGSGKTGTLTNGPMMSVGKVGQGIKFDGVDDYVEVANPTSFNFNSTYTFAAWVKPMAVNGDLISKTAASAYESGSKHIYINSTGKLAYNRHGGNEYTSTSVVPRNTWSHVAVVRTGSAQSFYINGKYDNGFTYENATDLASPVVRLGRVATFGHLKGPMDDARFYNRALSADEIALLYKLGK